MSDNLQEALEAVILAIEEAGSVAYDVHIFRRAAHKLEALREINKLLKAAKKLADKGL